MKELIENKEESDIELSDEKFEFDYYLPRDIAEEIIG